MIYYVTTAPKTNTVRRFLRANPEMKRVLTILTYEELFFRRCGKVGHYIFTDHDRLTRANLDDLAAFSIGLAEVAPDARQLNNPTRLKTRFPLLATLHAEGINSFAVTSVEGD